MQQQYADATLTAVCRCAVDILLNGLLWTDAVNVKLMSGVLLRLLLCGAVQLFKIAEVVEWGLLLAVGVNLLLCSCAFVPVVLSVAVGCLQSQC
ncbi:hypothetical protein ACJMK2_033838 [Sinanodonta woodiana]|uniref:Uncharacterized protein n=1 Tax=Sinanodonta woodiana TaxID=1069815 RepID=A0ABD3WPM8_SINWO